MTPYSSVNANLSNSQFDKSKSKILNAIAVTLKFSWNMISESIDETIFSHNLLLNDRQVSKFPKAFKNYSSIDIKLSKTQISKTV